MTDTQVLVVGAGPVGLLLAGDLGTRGVDVVVVERLAAPTGESRASQLNARTMEVLDRRDLLDRFGPLERVGSGHFGGIPLDVSDVAGAHPGFWKVPQFRTEDVLQSWALDHGVRLHRGHELRSLADNGDEVLVDLVSPAGVTRLSASHVVGCDGRRSAVRRAAGIAFDGADAGRELLRADVAGVDVPARRFERHPHGVAVAARRPDGVTRVMVHEYGSAARTRPAGSAPAFDDVVAAWRRVTGEDVSGGTPLWVDAFDDEWRHAATYRRGRVLLAGDAAHVHMPAGGQALNLGLQDADNLGWKLAAAVHGMPGGALDSYHVERHGVAARVLADVRAQTQVLLGGPELDAVRTVLAEILRIGPARAHLAAALSGLDVRYDAGTGAHPLAGGLLPHGGLADPVPAAVVRSPRWVLLDLAPPSCSATVTAAVAEPPWRGRIDVTRATARAGGPLDGLDTVLLRPDGHIAHAARGGTEPDPTGLDVMLCRWAGVQVQT